MVNSYTPTREHFATKGLIVGSANLTRQGFRENYECIVPVDYGGQNQSPRTLLSSAIELLRQISSESDSPQLQRQLNSFQQISSEVPEGETADDDPSDLVIANEVLPRMESRWAELSESPPEKLTIVSPFWPEGVTAANAIHDLIRRFQSPRTIELVCRAAATAAGNEWVPEFDADVANCLKSMIDARLFLRAALPSVGMQTAFVEDEDADDETEEHEIGRTVAASKSDNEQVQRTLHAKIIILDGRAGSVLYAGSSNCTRRGLGLGGPTNWETGFIYRLTHKQRRQLDELLSVLKLRNTLALTRDRHESLDAAVEKLSDAMKSSRDSGDVFRRRWRALRPRDQTTIEETWQVVSNANPVEQRRLAGQVRPPRIAHALEAALELEQINTELQRHL